MPPGLPGPDGPDVSTSISTRTEQDRTGPDGTRQSLVALNDLRGVLRWGAKNKICLFIYSFIHLFIYSFIHL